MTYRSRLAIHPAQSGQGLVEFALVLPIFLLAVFGIFDVGRLVFVNSTLSLAAREGARLGAAEASWIGSSGLACVESVGGIGEGNPGAHVCPADVPAFKDHVLTAVNAMAAGLGPITAVHISCNSGGEFDLAPTGPWTEAIGGNGCQDPGGNPVSFSGGLVSVRVQYTYEPVTPIIGSLIGSVPLSASATMVIH